MLNFVLKIFSIAWGIILGGYDRKNDSQRDQPKGRPPIPVIVTKAIKRDFPVYLSSVGHCRAYNAVDIVSQISGEIIAVDFEEGTFVEEGQILFHICNRRYAANLKAAEADLDRHRAQLSIDQVQLERSQSLMDKDYISKQEFETYSTRVAQDRANIISAEAAIERAKIDLEHCLIKAPFSGMLGKRMVDRGAIINAMQQLISIRQMTPLSVDFFISENDFPTLRRQFEANGCRLNLEISHIANRAVQTKGVLKFLDNKIDVASGIIHLRGEFSNETHQFWPGCTVRVKVELEILKDAIVVPSESMKVDSTGKPYLYQVQVNEASVTKHRAVQIYPEVRYRNQEFTTIGREINEGDMVILRGNMLLGNGSDVIPIPDGVPGGVPNGMTSQQQK
ncbi:MAG: efflux RND transporter periplasmic adaptor subunit [Puniceicoccales bacterium]|jgi:multidrug efflux system membrane fusion protein|nr:efflux RND transporter periplasmic adaptor subunit [Puniceicoccales bacterium]